MGSSCRKSAETPEAPDGAHDNSNVSEPDDAPISPAIENSSSPSTRAQLKHQHRAEPSSSPQVKAKKIFTSVLSTPANNAPQHNASVMVHHQCPATATGPATASDADDDSEDSSFVFASSLGRPRRNSGDFDMPKFEVMEIDSVHPETASTDPGSPHCHHPNTAAGPRLGRSLSSRASNMDSDQQHLQSSARERSSQVAFDLVYVSDHDRQQASNKGPRQRIICVGTEVQPLDSSDSVCRDAPDESATIAPLMLHPASSGSFAHPFSNAAAVGMPLVSARHRDNVAKSPKASTPLEKRLAPR